MDLITALALSIGLLGGIATYLFLGFGMGLQIWAAFIGWASYYHCGGQTKGLQDSIAGAIWGAVMATAALALKDVIGQGLVGVALAVALTVFVMIMGAKVPLLSSIPAAVYGYASTVALALGMSALAPGAAGVLGIPGVNVAISMAIGAVFGYVSQQLAGALSKS